MTRGRQTKAGPVVRRPQDTRAPPQSAANRELGTDLTPVNATLLAPEHERVAAARRAHLEGHTLEHGTPT